jgi:hypothetical protein
LKKKKLSHTNYTPAVVFEKIPKRLGYSSCSGTTSKAQIHLKQGTIQDLVICIVQDFHSAPWQCLAVALLVGAVRVE